MEIRAVGFQSQRLVERGLTFVEAAIFILVAGEAGQDIGAGIIPLFVCLGFLIGGEPTAAASGDVRVRPAIVE